MLAKRPLNIQIGGHKKTNHWTDKVLPNIPALVDYLTMPIEKVIKAAQDGQPILGLLNETTASAASLKSNQDQSFGTKGRKIALILFEPDPIQKMNEIVSQLSDTIACQIGNGEDLEERKEVTPFKNWADSSRMVIDSTPIRLLTPIQEQAEERISI